MLRDCKVVFKGREVLEFKALNKVFEGWINGFEGRSLVVVAGSRLEASDKGFDGWIISSGGGA